jgi:ligand-binding sensor domain-containing protein
MMMIKRYACTLVWFSFVLNSLLATPDKAPALRGQPVHKDTAYMQDYSIKYEIKSLKNPDILLKKVYCDRNGVVQVYSSEGLLRLSDGEFLYPGKLVPDVSYLPMTTMKIKDISLYQNQFVYADDKAVLSNAWAGKLYSRHTMPDVSLFCAGEDFSFLLSDGKSIQLVKDSKVLFEGAAADQLIDIVFDKKRNLFWLPGKHSISVFDPTNKTLYTKFNGDDLTCFALSNNNNELVVGTHKGYFKLNAESGKQISAVNSKLPCNDLTCYKRD